MGRFLFTKLMASMKHSGLTMRHWFHFYRNAGGSLLRVKRVHDAAKSSQPQEGQEEANEEKQRKAVEDAFDDALLMFLQIAGASVSTDIDSTVKEVGRKFLKVRSPAPWSDLH